MELVARDWRNLANIPENLPNYREVVISAIRYDGAALQFASKELRGNESIVKEALFGSHGNVQVLRHASAELRDTKSIVLQAVGKAGGVLQWAGPECKRNKKVVRAAAIQNGDAIQHAETTLLRDWDFVKGVVKHQPRCVMHVFEGATEEQMREAVRINPLALEFAGPNLRDSEDVALPAVRGNIRAMRYVSDRLRRQRNFVRNVLPSSDSAISYVHETLKGDPVLVTEAVRLRGMALQHVQNQFRQSRPVVLVAVGSKGDALQFASEDLKNDRDVVLKAVKNSGAALGWASIELRSDRDVVRTAVRNAGEEALAHASKTLRNDEELKMLVTQHAGMRATRPSRALSADTSATQSALEKALRDGSSPFARSRIILTGEGMAGKTALARSLLNEPFLAVDDRTVGADTSRRAVEVNKLDALQSWRLSINPDESPAAHREHLEHLVHAVQIRRDTVGRSESSEPEPDTVARSPVSPSDAQPGTRAFVREDQLPDKGLRRHAMSTIEGLRPPKAKKKPLELNPSDRDILMDRLQDPDRSQASLTFSLWDLGGQKVFYAFHQLFLTRYAVYLVLFDMEKLLSENHREECVQFLRHWINSIKLHSFGAPFFLVGSRRDRVPSRADWEQVNRILRRDLVLENSFRDMFVRNDEDNLHFWPVDNTMSGSEEEDPVIVRLRGAIEEKVQGEEYVNWATPLAWSKFLDRLMARGEDHVTVAEARDLADRCGMSARDMSEALKMFHGLGLLLHFQETEFLNNYIVLDPQWLISGLTRVLRDFSDQSLGGDDDARLRLDHADAFDELKENGIVSRAILDALWGAYPRDQRDFFLAIMERMMLICEWPAARSLSSTDRREARYLVPSLIRLQDSSTIKVQHIREAIPLHGERGPSAANGGEFSIVVGIDNDESARGFLPVGLFDRVVCLAAHHANSDAFEQSMRPVLAPHNALLSFGTTHFRLFEDTAHDRVRCSVPEVSMVEEIARELYSMMETLQDDVFHEHLRFHLEFSVRVRNHFVDVTSDDIETLRRDPLDRNDGLFVRNSATGIDTKVTREHLSGFVPTGDREIAPVNVGLEIWRERVSQNARAPLPASKSHHVFLSHHHVLATDRCRIISNELTQLDFRVWFDQAADDLTTPGMLNGVRSSSVLILFLTGGVLERPFVRDEVDTAMENEVPILLVHEANPDMPGYAPIQEIKAESEARFHPIFDNTEAIPFRRRLYEYRNFFAHLATKILQAQALMTARQAQAPFPPF